MKIKGIISALLTPAILLTGCTQTEQRPSEISTISTGHSETSPDTASDTPFTDTAAVLTSEADTVTVSEETTQTPDTQASDTQHEETEAADITDITAETTVQGDGSVVLPSYDTASFQNDLFIGDSIFTGLFLYEYLEKANVFAEVGLNPESALTKEVDGATCIQKAQDMSPSHIYIMLGTNGLAFLDPEYMAKKMSELAEKLKTACPDSQICIISIPPVTKAHDAEGSETMSKVTAYNDALETVCSSGNHSFIDICSLLKDDEGYFSDYFAENDGLHFKGNAYKMLLGTLQKAI